MAKEASKTKDEAAVKTMRTQREAQAVANEEAMERMDSSQPTPTQEENDLARLGVAVEEKEPDGSGPTVITKTLVANVPLGYDTKEVKAKETKKEPVAGSAQSYSRQEKL